MTDASLIETLETDIARLQSPTCRALARKYLAIARHHQFPPVAEEDVPGLIYFADQLADSIEQLEREPLAMVTGNLREKQWWHRAKKNVEDYRRMVRLVMAALPTLKPESIPLTEEEKREAVDALSCGILASGQGKITRALRYAEAALSALLERFELRRR